MRREDSQKESQESQRRDGCIVKKDIPVKGVEEKMKAERDRNAALLQCCLAAEISMAILPRASSVTNRSTTTT
ncbi:jg5052 [Pararge aegeria aegeria]|uniref:Jg5052 protein n=1 Tax=Pararge aegeria aegeria TaxID=348720 RepID=A0A8S4SG91_9NEOP|nr:jg5052 [Pararge aegeria aegeria]